jgi:hypothetical protein
MFCKRRKALASGGSTNSFGVPTPQAAGKKRCCK